MSGDIISQLQQATTDEQKTWIITEITLKTLPAKLADAVRVAAIPHWFDAPVLAALYQMVLKNYFKQYLVPFQFFEGHRR